MRHLDLFSGIGGFAYAADQVFGDVEHVFCDNDKFCQQVLKKHWPESRIYGDIRNITTNPFSERPLEGKFEINSAERHETQPRPAKRNQDAADALNARLEGQQQKRAGLGRQPDRERQDQKPFLLTGGFPCQPFSAAGLRRGTADERHLWPEMLRVIRLVKPAWVIAENVRGLVTWDDGLVLEQVCADLEAAGYEVQPFIIPAVAVNAPHRRDRVWFVAHCPSDRRLRRRTEAEVEEGYIAGSGFDWQLSGRLERSDSHAPYSASKQARVSRQPWQNAGSFIAYTGRLRRDERGAETIQSKGQEPKRTDSISVGWDRDWQEIAFATCLPRVDDGLPGRVVRLPNGTTISEPKWRKEALKAYGNAIVPQVAMQIMEAIKEADNPTNATDERSAE